MYIRLRRRKTRLRTHSCVQNGRNACVSAVKMVTPVNSGVIMSIEPEELSNDDLQDDIDVTQDSSPKMVPADHVNKLVQRAIQKGKKSMQDDYAALQAENERLRGVANAAPAQAQMAQGVDHNTLSELVRQNIGQVLQQQQQEAMKQDNVQAHESYRRKLDEASKSDPEIQKIASKIAPESAGRVAYYVEKIAGDMSPQVMAEIAKQPGGIRGWTRDLADPETENQAVSDLQELADRVKQNATAKQTSRYDSIPEPIERLSPTSIGGDGNPSIQDWRNHYKRQ